MVEKKVIDEVAKARKVLEDAEKKMHNSKKKVFSKLQKTARSWRMEGRLDPLEIHNSKDGVRLVCRG